MVCDGTIGSFYPFHIAVQNGKITLEYALALDDNSDAGISRLLTSVLGQADMPMMIYSINVRFTMIAHESVMGLTLQNIISNCSYVTNICISHPLARCQFQSDTYNYLSNNNTIITATKYSDFMAAASTTSLLDSFSCLK